MQKGVSPLIATVLLIAFTVGVAGIIVTWVTSFSTSTTQRVSQQADIQVICSYGSINLRSLRFANSQLSGTIENKGQIPLGNISLSIIYANATSEKIGLCLPASSAGSCPVSNLTLGLAERATFNVTISGSNYAEITVATNCTGVTDTVKAGDVAAG
jgi:flagellin-like protein